MQRGGLKFQIKHIFKSGAETHKTHKLLLDLIISLYCNTISCATCQVGVKPVGQLFIKVPLCQSEEVGVAVCR